MTTAQAPLSALVHVNPSGAITLATHWVTLRFVAEGDPGQILACNDDGPFALLDALDRLRAFGARVWETFFHGGNESGAESLALCTVDPAHDVFSVRVISAREEDLYPTTAHLNGRTDNEPDTCTDAETVALAIHARLLRA